jgi:thioredoxin 1
MTTPIDVTINDFDARVLGSDYPVVVDFWAEWCGPCKMMAPVLDDLAEELQGTVEFAKLDVDQYPEISTRYGVGGIPTLIVFQIGEEAGRLVGFAPKPDVRQKLGSIIGHPLRQNPRAAA